MRIFQFKLLEIDQKVEILTSLTIMLSFIVTACLIFDFAIYFRQEYLILMCPPLILVGGYFIYKINRKLKQDAIEKTF